MIRSLRNDPCRKRNLFHGVDTYFSHTVSYPVSASSNSFLVFVHLVVSVPVHSAESTNNKRMSPAKIKNIETTVVRREMKDDRKDY